jgi:small subunit ribosomal protein S5
MKGGRRFSFRATVVVGNRKGKVGLGTAKGSDVSDAINKAFNKAKKSAVLIKRLDSTISFRVDEKFRGAKIMIKPAKEGKGIVAGGAMRSVIDLAGIKNITAKSLGSPNKINVAKATLNALKKLEGKKAEESKVSISKELGSAKKASSAKSKGANKSKAEAGKSKKSPSAEKDLKTKKTSGKKVADSKKSTKNSKSNKGDKSEQLAKKTKSSNA